MASATHISIRNRVKSFRPVPGWPTILTITKSIGWRRQAKVLECLVTLAFFTRGPKGGDGKNRVRHSWRLRMIVSRALGIAGLTFAIALLSNSSSYAFDLDGAWTTDVSACGKIFEKDKEGRASIISGSSIYGGAFIVRGNSIFSANVTCTIKTRKDAGAVHHIVAVCAPGNVALSTFQLSYRVKDNNSIVRIYPGVEELDETYGRCF